MFVNVPTQVGTDTDWAFATAGEQHGVAVKTNGTLWVWGYNAQGQLGDNTTVNKTTPIQIGTDNNWLNVQAYNHNLGLKTDGTVWVWGLNTSYQLGDATITNRTSPQQLTVGAVVQQVIAGGSFSFFQVANGTIYACGNNSDGMLGDGTYLSRQTPLAIFQCSGLGMEELEATQFTLYPNPTQGIVSLKVENMTIREVEVYDIFGKMIYSQTAVENELELDLTQNQTGVYLVKITSENNRSITKKVVVQ